MPLPKKTLRVFPNPWAFIHHELGPQGRCHVDTGGRGSDPRFVGAEICPKKTVKLEDYESNPLETRLNTWKIVFRFPALNAELLGPAPGFENGIELAKSHYYLDRLRDGDLIPADKRTASDQTCRFASLAEAKAAAVKVFEEHYGEGSFAEMMAELAGPTVDAPADADAPKADQALPNAFATSSETTASETPNAKRAARASGADK